MNNDRLTVSSVVFGGFARGVFPQDLFYRLVFFLFFYSVRSIEFGALAYTRRKQRSSSCSAVVAAGAGEGQCWGPSATRLDKGKQNCSVIASCHP